MLRIAAVEQGIKDFTESDEDQDERPVVEQDVPQIDVWPDLPDQEKDAHGNQNKSAGDRAAAVVRAIGHRIPRLPSSTAIEAQKFRIRARREAPGASGGQRDELALTGLWGAAILVIQRD